MAVSNHPRSAHCLLMKAMQKASPQGLVYKRDVATGNIVQTLRKPAGVDGDAWTNYGHIGEVLRNQLTDVRCVKTIGTVNLVQGVSVKALDLFVALQNTALSPMQVVLLTALYQVGPHVGAQHFMDCSAAYRDVMLDLPFPATLRTQGVNVLSGTKTKHKSSNKEITRRQKDSSQSSNAPQAWTNLRFDSPGRAPFTSLSPNKVQKRTFDTPAIGCSLVGASNSLLTQLLRVSVDVIRDRGERVSYIIMFLKPDWVTSVRQLAACQEYGGCLRIDVAQATEATRVHDQPDLAKCVSDVVESITELQFPIDAMHDSTDQYHGAERHTTRTRVDLLRKCVPATKTDFASAHLDQALIASGGTSSICAHRMSVESISRAPRCRRIPLFCGCTTLM